MNDVTIIIIGMTGDLAKRKILPALYELEKSHSLERFIIVGAALEKTTCADILESVKPFISNIDSACWCDFCSHCFYQPVDAHDTDSFKQLAAFVENKERSCALSGNRLLYCSTSPEFYCSITQNSIRAGLIKRTEPGVAPWMRVVFEKPFGHDVASAHFLNECVGNVLHDEQIYRIDHYLTQEMVSNIALVRFTNCVFEPLWNNNYIDQVHIILDESIGIEGREQLYDKTGALNDVVQNHLLELVSLVAMEPPDCLSGQCIRAERAHVLEHVTVVDALRGQYEGYRQEPGVAPNSQTETFAAAVLMINNARWAGVPFYVRTGKYLREKKTEINIRFKKVNCPLAKQCACEKNSLTIQVAPRPSFALTLNVKKPGVEDAMMPIAVEYCPSCVFKERTAESYEILFEELIRGRNSVSVRFDEIEYAWKIIDYIKGLNKQVYSYKRASVGPDELRDFERDYGIEER